MPSISFLGTGSGHPSEDRFFSSFLLRSEGTHILVEAGEPCVHSLRERGTMIRDMPSILITHGHVDHIGGLPALLQGAMLEGRTLPLSIHLPREMIAPLRAWIGALYLTEESLGFSLEWSPWEDGLMRAPGGDFEVTPRANSHLSAVYRGLTGADASRPCESFSLEVACKGSRIFLSGDVAGGADLAACLSKCGPPDLLVCELSHMAPEDLAAAIGDLTVGTLCLVHLSAGYSDEAASLREKVITLLPGVGDVFVPSDGETIDF